MPTETATRLERKREEKQGKMEECCALCEKRAMMHCDSDQAKLCWDCDEKVHSANFLVAKHSRVLLCRLCRSPTPWKASGTKLTPTVSFCHRCVADRHARFQQNNDQSQRHYVDADRDRGREYSSAHFYHENDDEENHDDDNDDDVDDDSNEEEEDGEDQDEDEEGENQVVPMPSFSASSPPSATGLALKRLRNNSFSVDSHDETACSSSEMFVTTALPGGDESTSLSVLESLKRHRFDQRNS